MMPPPIFLPSSDLGLSSLGTPPAKAAYAGGSRRLPVVVVPVSITPPAHRAEPPWHQDAPRTSSVSPSGPPPTPTHLFQSLEDSSRVLLDKEEALEVPDMYLDYAGSQDAKLDDGSQVLFSTAGAQPPQIFYSARGVHMLAPSPSKPLETPLDPCGLHGTLLGGAYRIVGGGVARQMWSSLIVQHVGSPDHGCDLGFYQACLMPLQQAPPERGTEEEADLLPRS